jgi:hypothetical protein
MTKRILFLNGLAVLMLPFHHAASLGIQAMFFWTHRYRPVSVPNFDQIDSLSYAILFTIRQFDAFAIPAFFFVSGFFLAFMGRGKQAVTLSAVMPRLRTLLIPLIIWTVVRFVLLQRFPDSLFDILLQYYFIVLVIQYYLLAPWLLPIARRHWKALLIVTALIQLSVEASEYLPMLGLDWGVLAIIRRFSPLWFAPARIFYFCLGLVASLHLPLFQRWLNRVKWPLLATMVGAAVLMFLEYEWATRLNGGVWLGPNNPGFARIVYATLVPLCFLAFDRVKVLNHKVLGELGSRSLAIYLLNTPIIYIVASVMFHLTPQLLGNQLIYQTVLVTTGMALPLIILELVRRSPARPTYRYLFG